MMTQILAFHCNMISCILRYIDISKYLSKQRIFLFFFIEINPIILKHK